MQTGYLVKLSFAGKYVQFLYENLDEALNIAGSLLKGMRDTECHAEVSVKRWEVRND